MKKINHLGFVAAMVGMMAVVLVAIGLFDTVVERDIVALASDRPTITIPVSRGEVAGIATEQSRIIIDRGEGEALSVEFPIIAGMTVEDILRQITLAFELDFETELDNGALSVVRLGDLSNGDDGGHWQYSINQRTPFLPINQRSVGGGETINFRFIK